MTDIQFLIVEIGAIGILLVVAFVMIANTRAMIWRSPPMEYYLRTSMTHGNVTVEPGIEWRHGDDIELHTRELQRIALHTAKAANLMEPMLAAEQSEQLFRERWPGRAFFVEVHDKDDRWSQAYAPYGQPRWSDAKHASRMDATQKVRERLRRKPPSPGTTIAGIARHDINGAQHRDGTRPPMGRA